MYPRVHIWPLTFHHAHKRCSSGHLHETQIDLYSDDATQYVSGSSLQKVQVQLNTELKPIVEWNDTNKMVINEKKTKAMIIASSRKLFEFPVDIALTVNGSPIDIVSNESLLGVHLDQSLNWTTHVDKLCKIRKSRSDLVYFDASVTIFHSTLVLHSIPMLSSFANGLLLRIMGQHIPAKHRHAASIDSRKGRLDQF